MWARTLLSFHSDDLIHREGQQRELLSMYSVPCADHGVKGIRRKWQASSLWELGIILP